MEKTNRESPDFLMEIPQSDYLNDIEIQDEYEKPSDNTPHGLSDEQVSQLALDSLTEARRKNHQRLPTLGELQQHPQN